MVHDFLKSLDRIGILLKDSLKFVSGNFYSISTIYIEFYLDKLLLAKRYLLFYYYYSYLLEFEVHFS